MSATPSRIRNRAAGDRRGDRRAEWAATAHDNLDRDEHLRADTTLEGLAKLKPVFKQGGSVTAGNSSPLSDGAAGVIIMERGKAEALGLTPILRFVGFNVGGVRPEVMGVGPLSAVPRLLNRTGMSLSDIDLIELNEGGRCWSLLVALSLLTLAFAQTALMAFIGFVVYVAISPVIFLNLDIFLERLMTSEADTGRVRGIFMSMKDIAQIGSPLLVSLLASEATYTAVYLTSALATLVVVLLLIFKFSHFKDACYIPEPLLKGAQAIYADKGLRGAWISQLVLYFFYGWMVMYVPLYLNQFIGFGWETLGIILSIMLVALPIVTVPTWPPL